jgi:hypothetical protein
MKKFLVPALLFSIAQSASAQVQQPVKWTFSIEKQGRDEALLILTANIDEEWHIYSQHTPDGGPLPTVFMFDENPCYKLKGKVSEPQPHVEYDSVFEVKVWTLAGNPSFTQKIKLESDACSITGRIEGQVCKEMCIMFQGSFEFNFGKAKEEEVLSK